MHTHLDITQTFWEGHRSDAIKILTAKIPSYGAPPGYSSPDRSRPFLNVWRVFSNVYYCFHNNTGDVLLNSLDGIEKDIAALNDVLAPYDELDVPPGLITYKPSDIITIAEVDSIMFDLEILGEILLTIAFAEHEQMEAA